MILSTFEDFSSDGGGLTSPAWLVRVVVTLLCVALLLLAAGNVARASDSTLFTVTGVDVDVTAEDAAKAKLKGFAEAQVKAFHILVERLGSPGDAKKVASFKPGQIGRLMASMSVEQERTGPQRYVGRLTVKFLPKRVRKALAKVKFHFVEEQSDRILVIPVWKTDVGPVLWDENPWRMAWQSLKAENSLVPVIVPLGDLTDAQALSPEDALARNKSKLEALQYRYEAESVLIAVAEATGDNSVHATMSGNSPVGRIAFDKSYSSTEGGVEAAALQAAQRFHTVMTFKWKKAKRSKGLANTNIQLVNIAVPFSSLGEWNTLRTQLSATSGVTGVDVTTLSTTGAKVRVTYNQGFENLRLALQQRRLNLTLIGGTWVLQPF